MSVNDSSGEWLTVPQAAARLRVSARAIQKRAARGTLSARKVERGGATVWEIDGRELGANPRTNGREPANLSGQMDANAAVFHAQDGREQGANMDAATNPNPRTNGREPANRDADFRAEISFLRGVIEQLQRDGAETRAALRKALELAPKELPAPAPENRSEAGESGGAASTTPEAPKGPQNGPEHEQAGKDARLTYGDIANWLEQTQTSD